MMPPPPPGFVMENGPPPPPPGFVLEGATPDWQQGGPQESGTSTVAPPPLPRERIGNPGQLAARRMATGETPQLRDPHAALRAEYSLDVPTGVAASVSYGDKPGDDAAWARALRNHYNADILVERDAQGRRFYRPPDGTQSVLIDRPVAARNIAAGIAGSVPEIVSAIPEGAALLATGGASLPLRMAAGAIGGAAGGGAGEALRAPIGAAIGMRDSAMPSTQDITSAATMGGVFGGAGPAVGAVLGRVFGGGKVPAFLGNVNPRVLDDGLKLTGQRVLTDSPQTVADVAAAAAQSYRQQINAGAANRAELIALEQDALRLAGRARAAEEGAAAGGSQPAQQAQIQRGVQAPQQGAQQIGPGQPVDMEAAGQSARGAVEATRDAEFGAASQAYQALERAVGNVPVTLTETGRLANQLGQQLQDALIARPGSAGVIRSLQDKINSGQPFTLADIRDAATILKERARSLDPEKAVDSATVRRLISALETDRDVALQTAGHGRIVQAYRTLDRAYGEARRTYRSGTTGRVLDESEPGVFSMHRGDVIDAIAGAAPSEIRRFRTSLAGNQAALAEFEGAVRQRLAATVRAEGGAASGDKLSKALAVGTREGDALRAALPPDQIRHLERIAAELSLAQRQPTAMGGIEGKYTSIVRHLARAWVGLFTTEGRMMTAAQRAMGNSAQQALERAVMDPKYLADLARLSRMTPGSRAARDLAASLGLEAFTQ